MCMDFHGGGVHNHKVTLEFRLGDAFSVNAERPELGQIMELDHV